MAAKYGVGKYVKLGVKALEANWDETTAKWTVKLQVVETDEIFEDTADVLVTGIGVLNS